MMSGLEERLKMEERSGSYLRHYPSTPHLDSFSSGIASGGAGISSSSNYADILGLGVALRSDPFLTIIHCPVPQATQM